LIIAIVVQIRLKENHASNAGLFAGPGELFVNIPSVTDVSDEFRVLIGSLRIGSFTWNIINSLSMLPLIPSDHVDWLLKQVEIEVLVAERRCKIEITIDEGLGTSIEESIYIRLVPTGLFDRLKFTVEVVKPLTDVALIWLNCVIPRGIIKTQINLSQKL
jgi:hypothetical protein